MPDNTWYTPYELPQRDCLSAIASQGVVYRYSSAWVIKMPFQYPPTSVEEHNESQDHFECSQASLESFQREREFYEKNEHPNFARANTTILSFGLFVEYLRPVESSWSTSTKSRRKQWICQLLRAVTSLADRGIIHGDLAIRNLGIDQDGNLKLFDFGSVQYEDGGWFDVDVPVEISKLGHCLHFLVSGKDNSAGRCFTIDPEAALYEDLLQRCWKRDLGDCAAVPITIFRRLQDEMLSLLTDTYKGDLLASTLETCYGPIPTLPAQSELDHFKENLTRDSRWLDAEDYVQRWRVKGITSGETDVAQTH